MTLKIGHIEYANCTPIFSALTRNFDCADYHFVKGVPSRLNRFLSSGEIDVCPSSSIEYGKSPEKYLILPELSISAIGPVRSVLLFSRVPLEELNGRTIALTSESDTSVNLLKILLAYYCGFRNSFERTSLPLRAAVDRYPALLLIGDNALKGAMDTTGLHVYDLGELWWKFTGLPFVFALWIVRREAVERARAEVTTLLADLLRAKAMAYETYEEIAAGCDEKGWIDRTLLVEYWRTISYDLTDAHIEGLRTFFMHGVELGILAVAPEIRLFGR